MAGPRIALFFVMRILGLFLILASFGSFAGELSPELLKSVMDLKENAKIPSRVYSYDSKDVARALIMRKEQVDLQRKIDPAQVSFDFLNRSKIIMGFQFKYFDLIKKNGFLNQFQVNHSVNMDRKHRALVEDQMIGLKLKRTNTLTDSANALRPKYSYLVLDIDFENEKNARVFTGPLGTDISELYGNVFAKFKEEVKERSTLTAGDSLYIFGSKTGDARSFKTTQTYPESPRYYFEAQIWGELTLDDVDYVLVNCSDNESQHLTSDQIESMKLAGVDVFQCIPHYQNPIFKFARYRLEAGEKL